MAASSTTAHGFPLPGDMELADNTDIAKISETIEEEVAFKEDIQPLALKGPTGGKLLFEGSVSIGGTGVAPGLSSYSTIAVAVSATSSSCGESYQPAGSPIRGNADYCLSDATNKASWTIGVSGDSFTVSRILSYRVSSAGVTNWDTSTGAVTRIYGIETQ